MKFQESSLPVNYAENIRAQQINWDPNNSHLLYNIIFASITDFCRLMKGKDKMAFVVDDEKGNFVCAAVCDYQANEDPEQPGSYSYTFTTNAEDIADAARTFKIENEQFESIMYQVGLRLHQINFKANRFVGILTRTAFRTLLNWLDVNASTTETIEISLDGYFIAQVAVEGGEKVTAIIPDGTLTRMIKDDASIEK